MAGSWVQMPADTGNAAQRENPIQGQRLETENPERPGPGAKQRFTELLNTYRKTLEKIVAVCSKRYRIQSQGPEDVLQEVLNEAWRGFSGFERGGPRRFIGWFKKVAQSTIADLHRRECAKKRTALRILRADFTSGKGWEPAALPESIDFDGEEDEMLRRVIQALKRLPPDFQSILLRKFYDGITLRKIARERGCSESFVFRRLHQALVMLKSIVQDSRGRNA